MKLVLAGTRSFGAATLGLLIESGHDVAAVVAPPGDRTACEATRRGLFVAERCDETLVAGVSADLIVAAHSHAFIGKRSRGASKLGAIGYHPSLLPRHRGRDAVRWTIHMKDPIAGGSVYWFTDNIDAGPIAAQEHLHVDPKWDHHELWKHLFQLGLILFQTVLRELESGVVVSIPQGEACATWEPSIEDGDIPLADREWVAALLEGEGYIGIKAARPPGPHRVNGEPERPFIKLEMTDRDVVERAAGLMGGNAVMPHDRRVSRPNSSVTYRYQVSGKSCMQVLHQIRPFMGARRGARIDEMIDRWGTGWDRPPIHRPDLIEIGPMPNGYRMKERV